MTRSVLILLGLAACATTRFGVHLSLPPPGAYRPAETVHLDAPGALRGGAHPSPALRAAQHGVKASEAAILGASAVDNPSCASARVDST